MRYLTCDAIREAQSEAKLLQESFLSGNADGASASLTTMDLMR